MIRPLLVAIIALSLPASVGSAYRPAYDPLAITWDAPGECLGYEPVHRIPYAWLALAREESEAAGVPLWIAGRLIWAESRWHPRAAGNNPNGTQDMGFGQLNSAYLEYFARYNDGRPVDPFSPRQSLRVAFRYLAELYAMTGTWPDAVAAYNCGPGRWKTGDIPEVTRRHVARIFND